METLNFIAVVASAVSAFIIGGLWYSPLLFGKAWMNEMGLTEADLQQGNMATWPKSLAWLLSLP